MEREWLTAAQVAESFQVSESWLAQARHRVRVALENGEPRPVDCPPFIELGRAVRYPRVGVEEFVKSNLR